jgi:hypothetical protein
VDERKMAYTQPARNLMGSGQVASEKPGRDEVRKQGHQGPGLTVPSPPPGAEAVH